MSRGFSGPKLSEIRSALGIDRNISSEVVPTASQVGAFSPTDRQNVGYSGTPMWKLAMEREAREAEARRNMPTVKIPQGFMKAEAATMQIPMPLGPQWYFSEKSQTFWNGSDQKYYVYDPASRRHFELHEAKTFKHKVSVGNCVHEEAIEVRQSVVIDLSKAAQSLRLSIEHLDRPCSLYALYEGHNGAPASTGVGNVCADFCSKQLHQKLIPKLAAFRGYWEDEMLRKVLVETFEELDADFIDKNGGVGDGCCASVILSIGDRLAIANAGDVACVGVMRNGEAVELIKPHAVPGPDDEDDDEDDDAPNSSAAQAAVSSALSPSFPWTRSFGDVAYKKPGVSSAGGPSLTCTPEVRVLHLAPQHQGVAIICRALYNAIGRKTAVSTVFRRSAGRPRLASGALVDAAVQWLGGQIGTRGLGSVVLSLDNVEAAEEPPQKKPKTAQASQVRLRHILLKHRECKSTVDKVRNKQVKRTRGEAERLLRGIIEECDGDQDSARFTQRCRELSECQSCLKAGDLVGDIGWMKPGGKLGLAFDNAAFSLQVRQISDLVDTDQGIHVLLRSA